MAQARRSSKSEDWRYLVDAFRNGEIRYDFTLAHIQTVLSSVGIDLGL